LKSLKEKGYQQGLLALGDYSRPVGGTELSCSTYPGQMPGAFGKQIEKGFDGDKVTMRKK
jgi:hypothetical protein